MTASTPEFNARSFLAEMRWFDKLVRFRAYQLHCEAQKEKRTDASSRDSGIEAQFVDVKNMGVGDMLSPALPPREESPYADFLHQYDFGVIERASIVLGLLPHVMPGALEKYITQFFAQSTRSMSCRKSESGRLLPTGETLLFLLAGGDLELRMKLFRLFEKDHPFSKDRILELGEVGKGESRMAGILLPDAEIIDLFTLGYVRPPEYNSYFPAKHITTEMDWDDLVLAPSTRRQVEEVKIWFRQQKRLMNEPSIRRRLKPGYKVLFYGAPGTGKTLTAQLLGKYIGKDVFRVDLSNMVSKYIGETEKNLAKVFDKAEHSDWILFFDEADALFGTRTKVSSSNDRYANQEVSYLLQRIEDHKGIVILASNIKSNIDEAFIRRFSSVVHFPFPKSEERQLLWQKAFPEKMTFSEELDIRKIANKYEISGANITNIVAWCSLMAFENNDYVITEAMIREGMARELAKDGRTL